jgi:acetyl-CoA carboxylase carboxyltransferase component
MFVRQRVSARFFANSLDTARLVAERGVCGYFGNSTGAIVPLGCGEEQADRRWLAEYGGGGHAGLVADNPKHLGGAIDAPAGDKAARFLQLCDAFDIPIVSLCDTPGFMVGPEAEKTVVVRHVARMFVTGASLTVPLFGIVLRKAYGLGAQSMIGGGFHTSFFTMAWPTGEFGGMGWKAMCASASARRWKRSPSRSSAKGTTKTRSRSSTPTARRSRSPRCSKSTK